MSEQQKLHKQTVEQLSVVYANAIGEMTLSTAMNVSMDFAVASLLYAFTVTGKIKMLDSEVISREIANRIEQMKAQGKS